MASAKKLNNYYNEYEKYQSLEHLENLLGIVRQHVIDSLSKNKDLKYRSEDVAQDVLFKVWRSIDRRCTASFESFDSSKSSFSTWLSMVSTGIISKELRDSEEYESIGATTDLVEVERFFH